MIRTCRLLDVRGIPARCVTLVGHRNKKRAAAVKMAPPPRRRTRYADRDCRAARIIAGDLASVNGNAGRFALTRHSDGIALTIGERGFVPPELEADLDPLDSARIWRDAVSEQWAGVLSGGRAVSPCACTELGGAMRRRAVRWSRAVCQNVGPKRAPPRQPAVVDGDESGAGPDEHPAELHPDSAAEERVRFSRPYYKCRPRRSEAATIVTASPNPCHAPARADRTAPRTATPPRARRAVRDDRSGSPADRGTPGFRTGWGSRRARPPEEPYI